jgi:NitT/TauT family transport system substrate-binding protein
MQVMLDGKADLATVAETPIMFNGFAKQKFVILANIEASSLNNGIVARMDTGIAGPTDLRGKKIGYTPGTTSDFFLDVYLTVVGLSREQILPVPLKPEEMKDAITSKKVDAVCTWNYPLTQIKDSLGSEGIIFFDHDIYTETFNIVGDPNFVSAHPETVKRVLRALLKAEAFVKSHKDESVDIMAQETHVDRSLIDRIWGVFTYHIGLDQTLMITLEDEARWAIKRGLLVKSDRPDFSAYLSIEGMKAVAPDDVRINQ